ncbi:MAG: linear amide C-N hydrolase [Candidatus Eiseniibacteriota bacterium]|nr:MAG: linear amide C-N hydrolase [Candidatus Eisenbacteria bacterium]
MRTVFLTALSLFVLVLCVHVPCQACTSFCLETEDGPVYGTNLDLHIGEGLVFVNRSGVAKQGYLPSASGQVAAWTSRYGSISFNLAGREFAWCGINEAGLVVSTMWLEHSVLPPPDERPPLNSGFWVQYQLDNCATVQEVMQTDSLVRLTQDACHFMVCDQSGNCASIEFLEGRMVFHTGDSMPVKVLTNIPYAEALSHMDQDTIPQNDPGDSIRRFVDAAASVRSFAQPCSVSAADHAMDTLVETVVAAHTKWNIVFDIPRREVYFRTTATPLRKQVSLGGFDVSCEAPLLMLDVDAKLEGDVAESFKPYEHDVNLSLFRSFCERWGIQLGEEEAVQFMQFLESFQCAP